MEHVIDQQTIQALVAEGNDERLTRLIYALFDVEPECRTERADLLQQLGARYLALAIAQESDLVGNDWEEVFKRLDEGTLIFSPQIPRNSRAIKWYCAACCSFSAVLRQAPALNERTTLLRHRLLAHTLHGGGDGKENCRCRTGRSGNRTG